MRSVLWSAWGTCQAAAATINLGFAARDALIAHYWYAAMGLVFGISCALYCREICYMHLRPVYQWIWASPVDAERVGPQ